MVQPRHPIQRLVSLDYTFLQSFPASYQTSGLAFLDVPHGFQSSWIVHESGRFQSQSMRLVANQSNYHAVQVEEEHDQVEAKLDK